MNTYIKQQTKTIYPFQKRKLRCFWCFATIFHPGTGFLKILCWRRTKDIKINENIYIYIFNAARIFYRKLLKQIERCCSFSAKNMYVCFYRCVLVTAQKMKFSIKDFFSKCDQIRRKLRIWSYLVKKSLMKNFILSAACMCLFSFLELRSLDFSVKPCFYITFSNEKVRVFISSSFIIK